MIKKESGQGKEKTQTGNPAPYLFSCHSQCQCCCQYQDAYLSHNPFLTRQCILASGVMAGFLGGFLGFFVEWHFFGYYLVGCFPLLGLVFYCCCVTLGDGLSHFVLKLKPSSFSDESLLLKFQGVTGEELDHYCDTRRNIRMVSLSAAAVAFGIFWYFVHSYALVAFCIAYILSTILGVLFARCSSSTKFPRIIRSDPRYAYPWPPPPMSGHNYLLWQQGKLPYWW